MSRRPGTTTLAVVLLAGVVATGTGALFSRAAYDAAGGGTVAAGLLLALVRMGVTAGLTAPSWRHGAGDGDEPLEAGTRRRIVVAGLLLSVHFATWLPSLVFTSVAASVTIVTTGPVWVALFLWLRGERPSGRALLGIAVAIVGGAVVAFGDVGGLDAGSNPLLGNALALVAAITYAGHLMLGRSVQHRGLGLWQWTSAVAGIGALGVLPLVVLTVPGSGPYPLGFWLGAIALALVPQMVGHTSFIWAVRWLSPTLVSVVILLEPLVSSLGAFVLFDEVPGPVVGIGALVLVVGVGLTTLAERDDAPTPATEPISPI